jgi:CMP-N,N'-diacetyllegionaminic acid synthase
MADDNAPMSIVLSNALDAIGDFGSLCLLEPTSPLRYPEEVVGVLNLLDQHPNSVVATVHSAREAPELMYTINSEGSMGQVWEGQRFGRRQDRPNYHILNGLVYAATRQTLLRSTDLREHDLYGFKTETERSISIDTVTDLARVSEWLKHYPAFPKLTVA